jgi:hypothetical protein
MNDISQLRNDSKEGRYFEEVIREVVNRKSVDKTIRDIFNRGETVGLGKEIFAYVASFSEMKTLRNLWREFAGEYTGAVVEFDFSQLFEDAVRTENYATLRLLYDRREQDDKVRRTVDNAIQLLRSLEFKSKDKSKRSTNPGVNQRRWADQRAGVRFATSDSVRRFNPGSTFAR